MHFLSQRPPTFSHDTTVTFVFIVSCDLRSSLAMMLNPLSMIGQYALNRSVCITFDTRSADPCNRSSATRKKPIMPMSKSRLLALTWELAGGFGTHQLACHWIEWAFGTSLRSIPP
jgi:hypothetical protein